MDVTKILSEFGIQMMNDIRANMGAAGQNATGETGNSLRIEIKQEGKKYKLQLLGRPYFMTVQTGRKPTPDKKPSRQMINSITMWAEARSIDLNAVWAIATKIQQRGTRLWFEGGRTDIVDPAVDSFINDVGFAVLDAGAEDAIFKVRQMKW